MATKKPTESEPTKFVLPALNLGHAKFLIEGTDALIVNNWSEDAIQKIEKKQQMAATSGRTARDPESEYEGCFYLWPDGSKQNKKGAYAFPRSAFKRAMRDTCERYVEGTRGVQITGVVFILNTPVPIYGEPRMVRDMGRAMAKRTPIYRPYFDQWKTELLVQFDKNLISLEQVGALLDRTGFSTGVGNWRPEKNGDCGRFRVAGVTVQKG